MQRSMGFAALAILTLIPLLIVVAAANPASHVGLGGWVVYGMSLTDSAADAVTRLFSAPARVLGTTSVFSAVVLSVSGVAFGGSVQAGFERIWGLPAGPWHKIWRQVVWLVALIAYIYAAATVGTVTHGGPAETAGRVAVAVVLGIAFFWWGLRFLVGGRVSYLAAMPGAVATVVGLAGLRTFSGLVFDPLIARNAVSYGALGSFLIVQSWLIGVGWVVYGGQLFGRWFHDARLQAWADSRRGRGEPGGGEEGEQDTGEPGAGWLFEGELSELFPVALGLVSGRQAGGISVRTEDEAAVAEGRGAGHHDGQRQRLADQVEDPGPVVLTEQEPPEQAGRQRVEDSESGLRGGERTGRQGVGGQQHRRRADGDEHIKRPAGEDGAETVAEVRAELLDDRGHETP